MFPTRDPQSALNGATRYRGFMREDSTGYAEGELIALLSELASLGKLGDVL